MSDIYKKMYTDLFKSQTQAISILQEAQRRTEEMYIETEPPEIKVFTGINPHEADTDDEQKVD